MDQAIGRPACHITSGIEEDFSAVDGKVDAFDMVTLSDMLSSLADQQFVHPQFLQLADEYMQKGLQQPAHEVTKFLRFPQVFARALVARARAYIDPAGYEEELNHSRTAARAASFQKCNAARRSRETRERKEF
ncbi:unnamed protein product [Symbiodinium microadriaticum]|nr:unnamed protein product [Symbiodinium microadriaticum]